jgi:hypothetical protein
MGDKAETPEAKIEKKKSRFALSEKLKRSDKVSQEDAEKQFMLFVEFYKIDLEDYTENINKLAKAETQSPSFEEAEVDEVGEAFCEPIKKGFISIDKDGDGVTVTHHIQEPWDENSVKTIKYKTIKGKNNRAMSAAGSDRSEEKLVQLAGSLMDFSGRVSTIDKMHPIDFDITKQIAMLFLTI